MGCLPQAGGLFDQPHILIEQWHVIFEEEAAKADYDAKIAATKKPQDGQPPAGVQHERTMLGPGQ